ncbi:pullulanase-associated domain-containing protein [Orenia marismortui]|uniref:pullulanase-associated domain-containing protein n=1 Tax=Orenia marismortui TaxID=46469 RepID=UPI00037856A0|nr:pullulanase-associated domain-containing protein [Orenia marismortui]
MKKIFSLLLILTLALGLVACSSDDDGPGKVGNILVSSDNINTDSFSDLDLDLSTAIVTVAGKEGSLDTAIKNVEAGNYTLRVSIVDGTKEYYGETEVVVTAGEDTTDVTVTIDQSGTYIPEGKALVHYQRNADDYDTYTLWLWGDGVENTTDWPHGLQKSGVDDFGAYYYVPLTGEGSNLGLVPVDEEVGDSSKDGGDHLFEFLGDYNELWIFEGDDTVYISSDKEVPEGLISAEVVSPTELEVVFTDTMGIAQSEIAVVDKDGNEVTIDSLDVVDGTTLVLTGSLDVDNQKPYEITYDGKTVVADTGARYEDSLTAYDGDDLGATYNSDGTVQLNLWSPKATEVEAVIYDKADQNTEVTRVTMEKDPRSVWRVTLNSDNTGISDLRGYFYQYSVTINGETRLALDPYAKSMAEFTVDTNGNGDDTVGKAAIVDPSLVGPTLDFANVDGFEKREDAIIWEIHVRDFTSQEGLSLTNQFGTYAAFTEKLNYLKDLGVTHIQLLPVMSYYFGDESQSGTRETEYDSSGNNYNWGYDPHSYFAPEGMYSEDSTDPELRIKELKDLVQAIHDAGMAVTLDVVYNHMAATDIMDRINPGYYFREGANGSGCGNDTASTHAMMRKLIVDSLVYWTEEYKVDGFRFDLMGLIDSETIQSAYDAVAKVNPDTLFIGEGWRMYTGPEGTEGADQDFVSSTDDVAVFSDEIRNNLKSGYGSEGQPMFITGGDRPIETIFNNIKAQPGNFTADDPGDVVQYIAAHDNLTLHDVIAQSIEKSPADSEEEIQKRIRLGNAIILTSQGISFLHGGQEYGRTKEWKGTGSPEGEDTEVPATGDVFIHNSYDSSDVINAFDWNAATGDTVQNETMEYTKGLIKLRRSTDAFRLGDKSLVDSNVKLIYPAEDAEDKIIAYKSTATDLSEYYVFINGDTIERDFAVKEDLTSATVLVDNDESGATAVSTVSGVTVTADTVTVDPLSVAVIKVEPASDSIVVDGNKDVAWDDTSIADKYTDATADAWVTDTGDNIADPAGMDVQNIYVANDTDNLYMLVELADGSWGTDAMFLIDNTTDSTGISDLGANTSWTWGDKNIVYSDDTSFEGILYTYLDGDGNPGYGAFTWLGTEVQDDTVAEYNRSADGSIIEVSYSLSALGLQAGDDIRILPVMMNGYWEVTNIIDAPFDDKLVDPTVDQELTYQTYTIK